MKTRIFIGLAVMLMTLFGITAYANENNDNPTAEANIDGLNYFLDFTTHEATITTDHTVSGEVNIPSEVNYNGETFVVKSMLWCSFYNNQEVTKVRIPKTLVNILHYYPYDPSLQNPPSGMVDAIHMNPFIGCTALESIEVDEENTSLKSVDGVLFSQDGVGQYYYKTNNYYGTGLYCYPGGAQRKSYAIPDGVEWISSEAFFQNQFISTLTIPNSIKQICGNAFQGCSNLADVYCYANNVPVTFTNVFDNFPIASATLHVPEGSIEKYKTTSPWKDFGNIVALGAQYSVNAQVLTVSDIQNSGCLSETRETRAGDDDEYEENRSIILTKEGNTLKVQLLNYIDNCGIWGFDVIPYVSGGSNGEPYTVSISVNPILGLDRAACVCPYDVSFTLNGLETNSFNFSCYWCEGVVSLTDGEPLVIENSWDDIGVNGLNYKIHKVMHSAKLSDGETWEGELNIPSEINYEGQKYTVTSIDDNAFVNNTALTSVTIPSSVISIGYGAFKGCRNLANITIPNSVIWIDTNAFNNTAWYNNQPDGVVYAGRIAYKCKGTMPEGTNITIKEGTYAIANEAFHNCNGLASVTIPGSVTLIGDSSFKGCGNLASVTISEGVVSIGEMAFRDCSSLESINIPKSITKIADGTFWGCKSLASVNLSEGLTRMGIFVFADCPSLSSITIPGSLANAREYTFTGCTNLTSVVFSEGVKTIEQSIFFHCDNLSTISIPKSIKSIYGYAFSALSNLTDFYCFADSVPKISKETFFDTPIASATLHVPAGSIEKYKTTSPWKDFGNIVALEETVSYTKDQMATIILPSAPDASKGKYYRLDRCEEGKIIFTEELQPKARTPYIIIPNEDFSIDLSKLELESLLSDTVSVKGAMFIGSYNSAELNCQEGFYIDIIDSTPDCQIIGTDQRKAAIGALRAFLVAPWDDPYTQGPTKGIKNKREIVLQDDPNGIESLIPNPSPSEKGTIYDLSGRKVNSQFSILNSQLKQKGLYIKDGKKILIK